MENIVIEFELNVAVRFVCVCIKVVKENHVRLYISYSFLFFKMLLYVIEGNEQHLHDKDLTHDKNEELPYLSKKENDECCFPHIVLYEDNNSCQKVKEKERVVIKNICYIK